MGYRIVYTPEGWIVGGQAPWGTPLDGFKFPTLEMAYQALYQWVFPDSQPR